MRMGHLREKQISVFFNNIAAKGLREDVTLELTPLTCFVGLSEGGVASCGIDLKLLSSISGRNRQETGSTYYSGNSSGSSSPCSWRRVLLR